MEQIQNASKSEDTTQITDPHRKSDRNAIVAALLLNVFLIFPNNVSEDIVNNSVRGMEEFFCNNDTDCLKDNFMAIWPIYVNALGVAYIVGILTVPMLSNRFGRKRVLFLFPMFMIPGSMLQALASVTGLQMYWRWIFLCAGRFAVGLAGAVAGTVIPIFICEISSDQGRGRLGSIQGVFFSLGTLTANIVGHERVLGGKDVWHIYYWFTAVFSCCSIPVICFLKESPSFLMSRLLIPTEISESKLLMKEEHPKRNLRFYRGHENDFESVRRDADALASNTGFKLAALFTNPEIRIQTCLAAAVGVAYGPMALVVWFSNLALVSAQMDPTTAGIVVIVLEFLALGVSVVSSFTLDKRDRRPTFLVTVWCMVFCLTALGMLQALLDTHKSKFLSWLFAFVLVGLQMLLNIGPRILRSVLVPEIFPYQFRASGKAFETLVFYVFNWLYLPLPSLLAAGYGWVGYTVLALAVLASVIFSHFKLPETRNRSPADIFNEFNEFHELIER